MKIGIKNKFVSPFKQVGFNIIHGEGISCTGELLYIGVKFNLVEKSVSWYLYDYVRIGYIFSYCLTLRHG